MKKVIFISETLKSTHGGGPVRATADAQYDEGTKELLVQLRTSTDVDTPRFIQSRVSFEEAVDVAKDIFQNWIRGLVKRGDVCIEGA